MEKLKTNFKLNAKQLRVLSNVKALKTKRIKHEIYIVLDNVLDTYNIGSIFRLADAVAAKKIFLTAGSETPPNHRIKKASINTTEIVDWEYQPTAVEVITTLKSQIPDLQIVAIEQTKDATPYNSFDYQLPICLVVGHETEGVSKEVLNLVDISVELPMYGVNISLNVMVTLGVVLYKVLETTVEASSR